jgi:hypothetical protein
MNTAIFPKERNMKSTFYKSALFVLVLLALTNTSFAQEAGDQPPSMEDRYRALMSEHFANEPGIREVQQDAIRYVAADPERVHAWFTRVSLAALAPRRMQMRLDRDFRDNRNASTKDSIVVSGRTDVDDDALWQFLVEWDLSQLVFNPDSVRLSKQAIDIAELREDVLNAVTKIFFERRAVKVELSMNAPDDFSQFVRKRMRLDELTADLDALTGGAFSKRIRTRGN